MSAYYNEFDPFAAAWLRELIKDGLIADGVVDERSIEDVQPEDLREFKQCHFFAGIGGWSYAARLARWADDRPMWTGSPPCQPFSSAGNRKGKDDLRHLWPVFFNLISECQPPVVFGEQVASAIRMGWFDDLQTDMENEGYATGMVVLPANFVSAPHKRERLFYVAERMAHTSGNGWEEGSDQIIGRERGSSDEGRSEVREVIGDSGVSDSIMAYTDAHGRNQGLQPLQGESSERSWSDSVNSGTVGDTDDKGLQEYGQPGELHLRESDGTYQERSDIHSGFSDTRLVYCRDDKYRPIPTEPALFPLANGIPNRVGVLRGAGNAIVPQVGAEVIKAYMG